MRIVHLCWAFDPFMGYQEISLAREQMRAGHSVTVLTSNIWGGSGPVITGGRPDIGGRFKAGRKEENGIDVYRLPATFIAGRAWLKGIGCALDELAPEVVHCHAVMQYYSCRLAWYKRWHPGVRVVFDSHNQPTRVARGLSNRLGRMAGSCLLRVLYASDIRYVGITGPCCELMTGTYGVPGDRVYMIELGSDHRHYRPDADRRTAFRRQLGLNDEHRLVVNTGKIAPGKRLDVLVEAVAIARRQCPMIRLIQVGGGRPEYVEALRDSVARVGASDIVELRPAVMHLELADYFRAADVCAWPGTVTTSMIDAAACETALLVVETEGLDYQVSNDNAVVCKAGCDAATYAGELVRLCQDDARRLAMASRGRELVEKRLSWERIAERFLTLYEGRDNAADRWPRPAALR